MHNAALKITEISKELAMLPAEKLDEVKKFIDFILSKKKAKNKRIVQLEGIWEGKGFEKINIGKELKTIRKEWSKTILKRQP
ncbi:MAG TPA: hypothetical protein DHV16_06380 [Nitrospiraceae bacterium]|nr:MAG: hypothetical protein A2Z82_06410 [Nitrospirae bacterium GWA2_46_11]OGW24853.1 MAG: hypothetical protein A2X55_08155 [Nitrospirae bacterium GWB2_47_37]HAK88180.1 hypothetical protein [Nitrospiraceae bacterium]HCZ11870.1 hypothetical protein [Nitrospiraceae bacterium]